MILADSWYAKVINAKSFEELLFDSHPGFIQWLAKRVGIIRGIILYIASRNYSYIVTSGGQKGSDVVVILSAIFNKQNVVIIEFIRKEQPKSYPLIARLTFVPLMFVLRRYALKRALRAGHVLTHWEIDYYAQIYKLDPSRLKFIPWYYFRDEFKSDNQEEPRFDVFVSGRAALDWDLLFNAAKDQGWRIIVVCSRKDYRKVRRLSRGFEVTVFCEISQEEHNLYLVQSSVCAAAEGTINERWPYTYCKCYSGKSSNSKHKYPWS